MSVAADSEPARGLVRLVEVTVAFELPLELEPLPLPVGVAALRAGAAASARVRWIHSMSDSVCWDMREMSCWISCASRVTLVVIPVGRGAGDEPTEGVVAVERPAPTAEEGLTEEEEGAPGVLAEAVGLWDWEDEVRAATIMPKDVAASSSARWRSECSSIDRRLATRAAASRRSSRATGTLSSRSSVNCRMARRSSSSSLARSRTLWVDVCSCARSAERVGSEAGTRRGDVGDGGGRAGESIEKVEVPSEEITMTSCPGSMPLASPPRAALLVLLTSAVDVDVCMRTEAAWETPPLSVLSPSNASWMSAAE